MKREIVLITGAVALAACSKGAIAVADNSGAAVAERVAAEDPAINLKPGRWEGTTTVTKVDMPGMGPEEKKVAADFMQDKEEGKATRVVSCITPEAIRTKRIFNGYARDKSCKYTRFAMAGSTFDAALTCGDGDDRTTTTLAGKFNGDTMHMDIGVDSETSDGPDVGVVRVSMKMALDQKRVGECRGSEDEK